MSTYGQQFQRLSDVFAQLKRDMIEVELSGFDLREVENVIDQ